MKYEAWYYVTTLLMGSSIFYLHKSFVFGRCNAPCSKQSPFSFRYWLTSVYKGDTKSLIKYKRCRLVCLESSSNWVLVSRLQSIIQARDYNGKGRPRTGKIINHLATRGFLLRLRFITKRKNRKIRKHRYKLAYLLCCCHIVSAT